MPKFTKDAFFRGLSIAVNLVFVITNRRRVAKRCSVSLVSRRRSVVARGALCVMGWVTFYPRIPFFATLLRQLKTGRRLGTKQTFCSVMKIQHHNGKEMRSVMSELITKKCFNREHGTKLNKKKKFSVPKGIEPMAPQAGWARYQFFQKLHGPAKIQCQFVQFV